MDILVSLGVIALLIVVMLPSLSAVRVTTRKVLCASNTRQIGLGMHMYADDYRGFVPATSRDEPADGGAMSSTLPGADALTIRLPDDEEPWRAGDWDGLGLLFERDYLPSGPIFYCPSHPDEHTFERYAPLFAPRGEVAYGGDASIIGNYQYRGEGPDGERALFAMPFDAAIVSDALGTQEWVNHRSGVNVLRAGLSVDWLGAAEGVTGDMLLSLVSAGDPPSLDAAWRTLDGAPADHEQHLDGDHNSMD